MSYDVLVIGGGPAGLSAALNVRARGRTVLVVSNPMEENPLWRAEKVDNHLGMPSRTGAELLTELRRHAEDAGAVFREGRVLNTVYTDRMWYVGIGNDMEHAPAVVLASGVSRGRRYPGETEFLGRGVSYCATCDGMLYRNRPVAVVGFHDSARKEAAYLSEIGCQVTYIQQPRQCAIHGMSTVERLTYNDTTIPVDGVFILRPTSAPADLFPGLALEQGYVAVNRKMATNLPGLFAAGDCTGTPLQISKAIGEGLVAGQSAAGVRA